MDLDDDELKATREMNGSSKVHVENKDIKQLQEEATEKINEAVNALNNAASDLEKIEGIQHVMIIGYADVGVLKGFISSTANLSNMESQTTFLLDFASRNIKESVKRTAQKLTDELKKEIEKESNDVQKEEK